MMHFTTSDEKFRKKLPHGCKVKVPQLKIVGISQIHPLISDLIEKNRWFIAVFVSNTTA